MAAQNGRLDVVRFLAENGAVKYQADNHGRTPLWWAARHDHLDIVQFLVEVGADKNQASNHWCVAVVYGGSQWPPQGCTAPS